MKNVAWASSVVLVGLVACGSDGSSSSGDPQGTPPIDPPGAGSSSSGGTSGNPIDPPVSPPPPPGTVVNGEGAQCSTDFCWQSPRPSGNTLTAVWSNSPTDTWWVGRHGTILHDDGKALTAVASPTLRDLFSVGGTSSSDIWVSGDQVLFHFDGKAWKETSLAPVKNGNVGINPVELVAVAPNDVWMRDNSRVLHLTPNGDFTATAVTGLRTMGSAPAKVAGGERTIWIWADKKYLRWNKASSAFEPVSVGVGVSNEYPEHFWFSRDDDGYATVGQGLAHWDGATWSRVVTSPADLLGEIGAIGGSGPNDVWTLSYDGLFHFDGVAWTKAPKSEEMDRLPKTEMAPSTYVHAASFQANAPNDVWFGGFGGRNFHFDGTKWSRAVGIETADVKVILPLSATDIWLGSVTTAAHYDGTSWKTIPWAGSGPGTQPASILSATSVAPNAAWVADNVGDVRSYDGSKWTVIPNIKAHFLYASAKDDVWAVARDSNVAKHWNGVAWEDRTLPTSRPSAVWGTSKDHIWIGGADSLTSPSNRAYRLDPTSATGWTAAISTEHTIHAFSGSGPNDVYALTSLGSTDGGYIQRFNVATQRFSRMSNSPGIMNVEAIWSRSATEVWAVGIKGEVSRFDGTAWTALDSAASVHLMGISGDPSNANAGPFLVGGAGALLKKR